MRLLVLLPLLVIIVIAAAVVFAVIGWRRREAEPETDPGIGTVRRLYFYVVTFVALMMAASGVVLIVQFILEEVFQAVVLRPGSEQLAIGGSLLIVGLPLWLLHWSLVQKYVRQMPVERRSTIRKFFIYVVLGVSGAAVLISAYNLLKFAFGTEDFNGYHWGAVFVWAAAWLYYWRIEEAEGQPTADTLAIRRLYLYLTSLITLSMAAIGLGRIVHMLLLEAYDALFGTVLLPTEFGLWRPAMRDMLALAMVGAPAWAAHWLVFARTDYGSALRQVYLYIYAILGGVVTTLVSLGVIIFGAISWLIGAAGAEESAAAHFRFLPGALASLSVGTALWLYHWGIVQREAAVSQYESRGARRSYAYIMSALGLVALGVAAGIVVNTALGLITESLAGQLIAGRDLWRGPVAMIITLGVLGGPIWGYYWTTTQRRVERAGAEERASLARRVFIFALLGAGVLALLGSASSALYFFLRDLLDMGLSLDTARDVRAPLSIIAAVLLFLPYYWRVYLSDRQAEATETAAVEPRRKDVSALVGSDGDAFVRVLESALGYRVNTLRWADPGAAPLALSEEQAQELARQVDAAPGSRVLLVPDGEGVRVLSYN